MRRDFLSSLIVFFIILVGASYAVIGIPYLCRMVEKTEASQSSSLDSLKQEIVSLKESHKQSVADIANELIIMKNVQAEAFSMSHVSFHDYFDRRAALYNYSISPNGEHIYNKLIKEWITGLNKKISKLPENSLKINDTIFTYHYTILSPKKYLKNYGY